MSGIFANRLDRTLWKGGWREIGGFKKYYRSRWEANYARWLEREKQEGRIVSWAHEPKTFWFEGIKRGVNNYLPDFQVVNNDLSEEYHEVKGWMDSKSATKLKRMAKYHPDVKLVLVDTKVYRKLEKECSLTIEGWELLAKDEKDKEAGDEKEKDKEKDKEKKTEEEKVKENKPKKKGPTKKQLEKLENELK